MFEVINLKTRKSYGKFTDRWMAERQREWILEKFKNELAKRFVRKVAEERFKKARKSQKEGPMGVAEAATWISSLIAQLDEERILEISGMEACLVIQYSE